MNENEYLYLGRLVMAALEKEESVQIYDKRADGYCHAVVGPRVWKDQRGPTPIAALEAALTALGIALPERGEGWIRFDEEEEWDLDAGLYDTPLWVMTTTGKVTIGWRQGDTGDWSDMLSVPVQEMEDEWDHGCLGPYGVIAYKPLTRPEPYQEATP